MTLLLWMVRLALPALLVGGLIVDQGVRRPSQQKASLR